MSLQLLEVMLICYRKRMTDQQYLRALYYKFKYNQYPCMIMDRDSNIYMLSDEMDELLSCVKDDDGKLQPRENLELFQSFKSITEHMLLHITRKTFIVSAAAAASGNVKIFLSRKAPIYSPNGSVVAIEVHMHPMSMVLGAVGYFQSKYFYQKTDFPLSLSESFSEWNLTETQVSYLFFIIRNFTESDMADIFGVKRTSVRSCVDRIRLKMESKLGCKVKGIDEVRKIALENGLFCLVPTQLLPRESCIELHYDLEDWPDVKM
ncbi:conserved hypothetical protein [Vibrio chagasii]|nr:conserved hypothetical protein [Vibrio chagasii]